MYRIVMLQLGLNKQIGAIYIEIIIIIINKFI